jgi:hypothetical protein
MSKTGLELNEPPFMRGGTYPVGGAPSAELNVTYNYRSHYSRIVRLELVVRALYGMPVADSLPVRDGAISQLADDVSEGYWEATEGAADLALWQIRALAAMRPVGQRLRLH